MWLSINDMPTKTDISLATVIDFPSSYIQVVLLFGSKKYSKADFHDKEVCLIYF